MFSGNQTKTTTYPPQTRFYHISMKSQKSSGIFRQIAAQVGQQINAYFSCLKCLLIGRSFLPKFKYGNSISESIFQDLSYG
jgi:hypothetical protein